MDPKTRLHYEARTRILKALAHPSRLFILDVLSHGRRNVGELTELVGADPSTVSKHLSVLKGVGLVRDEKHGAIVFYEIQTPCVLNFFGCVEAVIKERARLQSELI